jgi:hypothetical protein
MSKDRKHHYIPVFYLKPWVSADGCVCEFSRPYDRVKPKRVHPKGTGYVYGLYSIPNLRADEAEFLEHHFFGPTDDAAARALQVLLGKSDNPLTHDERCGWSRFIVSLVTRNPESVAKHMAAALALYRKAMPEMQAEYECDRSPTDPPTYEQYAAQKSPNPAGRAGAHLLQRVTDSPLIGNHLIRMRWIVFFDSSPLFPLLTSDRPVVMTNGIIGDNGQILLPISPNRVFVATNNAATENYIADIHRRQQLFPQMNERVSLQSRKYVYGRDDAQFSFVSKRLGKAYTADPLENIRFDLPAGKRAS